MWSVEQKGDWGFEKYHNVSLVFWGNNYDESTETDLKTEENNLSKNGKSSTCEVHLMPCVQSHGTNLTNSKWFHWNCYMYM